MSAISIKPTTCCGPISRMMDDVWSFGLLLATEHVLAIASIDAVQAAGGLRWPNVSMLETSAFPRRRGRGRCWSRQRREQPSASL
jgi:hypothetical protein